ncbi:Proton glutamate symport protein [Thalassoglobus neptunius]|uniref:Proton glutamate symport protein n=1 Tax=Thalassoglobus neptunius TaxID=1938619 RepID=A0A5C5W5W2_9PLAN|nr:cation:dicarboxylase symporter family transporter [Thalassoglobus neptunius]TWT46358.1 Proton glutamate symport protein [Thalassoglobus neptunius]
MSETLKESEFEKPASARKVSSPPKRLGLWIGIGLVLGILCGLFFGELCAPLQVVGNSYVNLLQMTVLPYLITALISKLGRLNIAQAKRIGWVAAMILLLFWGAGILLVVTVSAFLPPLKGGAFFHSSDLVDVTGNFNLLNQLIPGNVFHSLANEFVPAVVVFCLFFGAAMMAVPNREPVLNLLDSCSEALSKINSFLIRLAPVGLFTLTAAAAGTLRVEEISRLQAYLLMVSIACAVAALLLLPLLVTGLTKISYRELLRAAQEPLLTALATGKLFVVLPLIAESCEELLQSQSETQSFDEKVTPSVVVPLAYPFPHIGKVLSFLFISFAAWYAGRDLSWAQSVSMASTGTISNFASPLITIPFLLDIYRLPQDLMTLFILPGFLTTRMADAVGVMHLMALTLIVNAVVQNELQIRWRRLVISGAAVSLALLLSCGMMSHYLASIKFSDQLDSRFLSLSLSDSAADFEVFHDRYDIPKRQSNEKTALKRIREEKLLRVGYVQDHLPFSFFNSQGKLVGYDVELLHQLAKQLNLRIEFVPFTESTIEEQLDSHEVDVAIGGLIMKPARLLRVGFTEPYQTATISVVLKDHRRDEWISWEDAGSYKELRLGVVSPDLLAPAKHFIPNAEIVAVDSYQDFFHGRLEDVDGLMIAAEQGAAWTVLYPEYTTVIPRPAIQRPVGFAVQRDDIDWINSLNRWLDIERLDGTLDRLERYWIEGGGAKDRTPRWCILRDVLHWVD